MRGFNIRSKESRLRQKPYPGLVVASKNKLYFIVDVRMVPKGLLGQFGAVGGAVSGMIQKKNRLTLLPERDPLVTEMDLDQLPADITEHADWPVDFEEGWVLVVPKDAVQSMRSACLLGGIKVDLRDVSILVFTPIFQRKKMAGILVDMGWDVEGA
jgi:hypothetical protein